MTRDQQIVEASLRLPYLKNQDQQLCFQQGAVWADHNPAWQGETIYHVTVSGHASNNKGKWIDNEVRTEFNNIIISEPNIRQLRHTLELIVSKAGQLFPRSTYLQMRDIRHPVSRQRKIRIPAMREKIDCVLRHRRLTNVNEFIIFVSF